MNRVLEHIFLPGEFVDAEFIIRIYYCDAVIGEFGCQMISQDELEDGIAFRASTLLRCGMDGETLAECRAVVERGDAYCVFRYDQESYLFREDNND